MTRQIQRVWRMCKHNELIASINTNVISRIHNLYITKEIPSQTNTYITASYPVYNTHVLNSEWDNVIAMIKTSLENTIQGIEVKNVNVSQSLMSYNCITIQFTIPKSYWEDSDSSSERV